MSRRTRDEAGVATVLVAMFFAAVFFGLSALTVDVARWYLEGHRVQKAADAAALAGVTWMPQDLAQATLVARDMSARNGYPNTGSTTVVVAQGNKPSQLKVTVSSTVDNVFGAAFGKETTTITRHAIADYTGPQPMGSPCNTLGNEPAGTPGAGPIGSQLSIPPGAACSSTPQFWMSAHGPNVHKTQGDQYDVRYCESAESGCDTSSPNKKNTEFDPGGYFLMLRVRPAAVGSSITVQLYDPAYVSTESGCTEAPGSNVTSNNWNDYATTDAIVRYAASANGFCSGDNRNDLRRIGPEIPTITSFGLKAPADNQNPLSATPVTGCTRQYPGYSAASDVVLANWLKKGHATYKDALARVFHQWVPLCSFTPTDAGDYYLQVRTNVPIGGPVVDVTGSYQPTDAASSALYTQAGDNASVLGNGSNRYAVRAYGASAASMSVSAYGKLPIFANADTAAPIFNLVRVLPGGAGKQLVFKFYDVGDAAAASGATLSVLRPTEATGSALANCVGSGFKNQAYPSCSISGIHKDLGWNGQAQTLTVPIPADYNCNYLSPGGCWFRVQMNFGSGTVTDATTWTASISGDPVRLIE